MRIGFIGGGRMAQAIVGGIASKLGDTDLRICLHEPSSDALAGFRKQAGDLEVRVAQDNSEVVSVSDYVILAVKPQLLEIALDGIKTAFERNAEACLVSIVAGVRSERISEMTGCEKIVRVMPNTPCLIGKGVSAISTSAVVSSKELQNVKQLLEQVGTVVESSESQMDAVTGLSGSGPAYVYTFIESLIDAGVLNGLPRDIARTLAIETVLGATELCRHTGEHPAVLRDQVTSPGGTTINGMNVLESAGFRGAVLRSVSAAVDRSRELGE